MTEGIALFLAGTALAAVGWTWMQVHGLAIDVAVLKTTGRSIDLLREDMHAMEARIIDRMDRMDRIVNGASRRLPPSVDGVPGGGA